MTISWRDKMREAKRIASLGLPGRATDLAIVLLCHLNPDAGVAWAGVEELAAQIGASVDTVGRATSVLDAAGVARFAKRRGAAARWFPAIEDMESDEAKRRVAAGIESWRRGSRNGGRADDPAKMRDQADAPADLRAQESARSSTNARDLKTPTRGSNVKLEPAASRQSQPRSISERAFALVDELARIAGLPPDSTAWPEAWRRSQSAQGLAQSWLDGGWTAELCIAAARAVMAKKKDGPPNSMKYFEPAIKRLTASLKSKVA
jgi:hypothetical protein